MSRSAKISSHTCRVVLFTDLYYVFVLTLFVNDLKTRRDVPPSKIFSHTCRVFLCTDLYYVFVLTLLISQLWKPDAMSRSAKISSHTCRVVLCTDLYYVLVLTLFVNDSKTSNLFDQHVNKCFDSLQQKGVPLREAIFSFFLPLRKHAYSNTRKFYYQKNENFQIKIFEFFHISAQNIDCEYSLEPPWRGGSNEYP